MSNTSNSKTSPPLPYHYYYLPVLLLVIAGLVVATYLSYTHYKNYSDLAYSSFCAISKAINCDTVSQSPWSILFGLPVSYWGIVGYCLFLSLLVFVRSSAQAQSPLWSVLFSLALIFSLASIYFGYITTTKIGSYCIFCIAIYVINFSLAFYCWIVCRRFRKGQLFEGLFYCVFRNSRVPLHLAVTIICVVGLQFLIPSYWIYSEDYDYTSLKRGITKEGHPWIGAEEAALTVGVYSDYQCFQCSKVNQSLMRLIQEHPDKIRLVHHHYPLDHEYNPVVVKDPFHVGSGKMALLAIYATTEDKFWEINDILFAQGRKKESFNVKQIAKKTNIKPQNLVWALSDDGFRNRLAYDIKQGMKLRITATPALVVDNQVYIGTIPPEIIKAKLDE